MRYGPNGHVFHEGWETSSGGGHRVVNHYWYPTPTQNSAHYAIMLREHTPGYWYFNSWIEPSKSQSANGPSGYIPMDTVKNLEEAKAWVIAIYRMR